MCKIIFWGTGKIGKQMHRYWRDHGGILNYFCNNDELSWGNIQEGIEIISPKQAMCIEDSLFFITCAAVDEVKKQLLDMNIAENRIIRADNFCSKQFIEIIEKKLCNKIGKNSFHKKKRGCYIDLSCGMVLGGVESWSYSLADSLVKKGVCGKYLIPADKKIQIKDSSYSIKLLNTNDESWLVDECIEELINGEYSTVICNFPFDIFAASCIVKRKLGKKLKLIAVVHNDEEIYYDVYSQYKEEIDYCLVISSSIKKKLISMGFPEKKIKDLYWKINTSKIKNREYSKEGMPIRLGYAGRIVKYQKRIDLIIEMAKKLKQFDINFCLQLVGSGDYEKELLYQIKKYSLEDCVHFLGLMDHDKMFDFWCEEDICISCSDFEGHSISHSEAMACGTVPIITNTSGARDDVKDGYNGFVVDIADIDSMVECIKKIYYSRELLYQMGERCRNIIEEKNAEMDIEKFWFPIINYYEG